MEKEEATIQEEIVEEVVEVDAVETSVTKGPRGAVAWSVIQQLLQV